MGGPSHKYVRLSYRMAGRSNSKRRSTLTRKVARKSRRHTRKSRRVSRKVGRARTKSSVRRPRRVVVRWGGADPSGDLWSCYYNKVEGADVTWNCTKGAVEAAATGRANQPADAWEDAWDSDENEKAGQQKLQKTAGTKRVGVPIQRLRKDASKRGLATIHETNE